MFEQTDPVQSIRVRRQHPSILIVDNEEKLGRFVRLVLNTAGYETIACRSIAEAREVIATTPCKMVLTDIVMPTENGLELIQWLGQFYPDLPIVVMTADSTGAVLNQALKLGVRAILQKPFTIDLLRQTVATALR